MEPGEMPSTALAHSGTAGALPLSNSSTAWRSDPPTHQHSWDLGQQTAQMLLQPWFWLLATAQAGLTTSTPPSADTKPPRFAAGT